MSDELDKKSYKQSLKATSLFGGVQIYNIVIGIVRSKFVAIFLGPAGMGITGLLSSTTGIINALTNMGLSTSAVRDISVANKGGDIERISKVVRVFRTLVWATGLIGTLICLTLSPLLSHITFGNYDYTVAFIILSVTLLFTQLTSGQNTLLQGMQQYAFMAKSNVIGSTIGLFITVPLYYFWRVDAIVPVLVITSVVSLSLSYYFSRKVKIKRVHIEKKDLFVEGRIMIRMGFFIGIQGILSLIAAYGIRIFIRHFGGVADVGLYSAGFTIVNTYVGLIFSAMATDYYPRLSALSADEIGFRKAINQQMEISLLLSAPVVASFIIFIKPVITLLYSSKFIPIEGMIYWAIFATFFKATSWSLGFSFLAKGDTKAFMWNELCSTIYTLFLNLTCYYWMGLTGLGLSLFASYLIYFIQVLVICGRRYGFNVNGKVYRIFIPQFLISCVCILLVLISPMIIRYIVGGLLVLISFLHSYRELDRRIEIGKLIKYKLFKR